MIGLVSCCGRKLETAAPAGELYISDLFRKSLAYLLAREDVTEVFVLSGNARLGLVELDQVIEPYDVSMATARGPARLAWCKVVAKQIKARFPSKTEFVVLGGRHYLAGIPVGCGYTIEEPLKGMKIGQRLRFLKESTK
jgi:hypothetical protein